MSSSKPSLNGSSSSSSSHPTTDPPHLLQLLQSIRTFDPSNPASTTDISTLLRNLQTADRVAQGVEERLDALLEDLEGMIGGLESALPGGEGGRRAEEEVGLGAVRAELAKEEALAADEAPPEQAGDTHVDGKT